MAAGFRSFMVTWMAIAIVMFAAPVFAQGEAVVQGQLRAGTDGAALPGATITLDAGTRSQPRQVVTDGEGRFVFARVQPGDYVVSAALTGFERRSVRVAIEPREVRTIPLSLDVGRVAVSVDVTAASTFTGTHSPSSTMLTAERIDTLPVFQRVNLSDAIVTSAPGMIRGHDDFVHIRGHEIALNPLINGVSFWENTHAVFSAGLSPAIVETANVMTGGFPAEYGNRFGGIVDIVTKSGLRMTERGSVAFSGGNAQRQQLSADVGGQSGGFGYYLFGDTFESDRFLSPPDPRAIHDSARGGHVFARLDTNRQRAGSFSAIVMADGTNLEIPNTPVDVELRPLAQADQRARQQTATFGWTRVWSDRTVVNASAYERWSRVRLLPAAGPLTAQADLTRELTTLGGKVDVTRLSGRHACKFGVDAVNLRPDEDLFYNYDGYRALAHVLGLPHIHVTGQTIQFSGADSGGEVSVYAQDNLQLGSRITLDAGLRLDRYSLVIEDTHLSPRLNLALRAGRNTVLHASYNHFFVPPAVEGVLSNSAGLTSSIGEIGVALPALKPTVEDQLEAGASTPVGPVQLALTGYFRATDNPVHTTVWPDSRIYSYASFDRARAYGLEAKAELVGMQTRGVSAYLNYALGRVNFYNPVTGGFITEAAHLTESVRFPAPMDQTHTLTAGAAWRHATSGLLAGLTMEYGSGTPIGHGGAHEHAAGEEDHADAAGEAEEGGRVPAHFMAGVSVGIDLLRGVNRRPRLALRLDIENISNRIYVIAQDSAFSPAQYSIPRLVALTARIQF